MSASQVEPLDTNIESLDTDIEGETIQQRFESFHAKNPWVYKVLVNNTRMWVNRGHKRIGIKMLAEVLRWQYGMATVGDDFKLNNNFTSRYVRLIIAEHPEFADVFETRTLRAS